jgi:RNA polymerase sigma factor (sigma-70 family)
MKFEAIYKKFNSKVFKFIKVRVKNNMVSEELASMVAEELASDVMMKVFKKIDLFDESKSTLSTWIINIAKNTMIDYFRKKHLSTVSLENVYVDWANGDEDVQVDHLMALKDSELNPLDKMIENETSRTMYDKFETLSEAEKIVASLHFFDGLSYDEVAEQLNMPLGTVKAKLHRARKTMMEAMPVEFNKFNIA